MEAEALSIIKLRDDILKEDSTRSRRLLLEKKIRGTYARKSQYGKYIKRGRYDLVDETSRKHSFTKREKINGLFEMQYATRMKRELETHQSGVEKRKEKRMRKTLTINEDFYDDFPESSQTQKEEPTPEPLLQQPIAVAQQMPNLQVITPELQRAFLAAMQSQNMNPAFFHQQAWASATNNFGLTPYTIPYTMPYGIPMMPIQPPQGQLPHQEEQLPPPPPPPPHN
jgi:hypothetical protein